MLDSNTNNMLAAQIFDAIVEILPAASLYLPLLLQES